MAVTPPTPHPRSTGSAGGLSKSTPGSGTSAHPRSTDSAGGLSKSIPGSRTSAHPDRSRHTDLDRGQTEPGSTDAQNGNPQDAGDPGPDPRFDPAPTADGGSQATSGPDFRPAGGSPTFSEAGGLSGSAATDGTGGTPGSAGARGVPGGPGTGAGHGRADVSGTTTDVSAPDAVSRLRHAGFTAAAGALGLGLAAGHLASERAQRAWHSIKRPFMAGGSRLAVVNGRIFGKGSPLARATTSAIGLGVVLVLTLLLGTSVVITTVAGSDAGGDDAAGGDIVATDCGATADATDVGDYNGKGVPATAKPWVANAEKYSKYHIPAAFFAYIMDRESDFNPAVFSDDANGGTWGLFQINAGEWSKVTGGGSFSSPDIKDPMVHTQYGAKYFDNRLEGIRAMRKAHPNAAYTKDLTELEDLMIAHNAGEGNLQKYPSLPSITKSYLAEYKQKFPAYGGGEASGSADTAVAGDDTSNDSTIPTLDSFDSQGCDTSNAQNVSMNLSAAGMSRANAQKLIDLYNKEGDAFLDKKYGDGGGPGSCGSNHAENCVSFSVYFLNKYTTFQGYPQGNGADTAARTAEMTGLTTTSTPKPYSIFSFPTSNVGHTGVVLAVNNDGSLLIGQADYCRKMGNLEVYSKARWQGVGMKFVDVSGLLKNKNMGS